MATKRIIANFFTKEARDKALEKISHLQETDSFLLGEVDENDIPYLKQQGLIVQNLDDMAPETPGKVSQMSQTGQRFQYQFSISGGEYLRVCMAYTDSPGRGLQNNLNLFIQHKESGRIWMGNQDLPFSLKIPDPDNNVEVVRLSKPDQGTYDIYIQASNLLFVPQDFALVVTGMLTSTLAEV